MPHKNDAAVKPRMQTMKKFFRPINAESQPDKGNTMPFATRYDVKIQVLSSELAPNEPAIYANATLAMVVSSTSINAAKLTTTETRKGRSGRCMAASILKNRSFRKYRGLYGHAGPQMDGAFRLRF